MNSSGGNAGPPSSPSHQYLSAKRSHSGQSTTSLSATELRELTNTIQELNNNFKRNTKVLTEIKDYIFKVCEKQETRPVDDSLGVHKLDRVRFLLSLNQSIDQANDFFHLNICKKKDE